MDIIQINKFSQFHNGHNVFFCKTDYVSDILNHISKLPHDVILISGNSDYCITDEIAEKIPPNLKQWFCQNRLSDNPILTAIPLGLDNSIECSVPNHGYVWPQAKQHIELLSQQHNIEASKLVYANFSLETNGDRKNIADICHQADYITTDIVDTHHQSNERPYSDYIQNILQHEAVVCPQGNGLGDNHRIYETLSLKRIPITFNKLQYKYLHHNFPVVLIENIEELKDREVLLNRIFHARQISNFNKLDYNYWHNMIKVMVEQL
jgi:hypothetical protein